MIWTRQHPIPMHRGKLVDVGRLQCSTRRLAAASGSCASRSLRTAVATVSDSPGCNAMLSPPSASARCCSREDARHHRHLAAAGNAFRIARAPDHRMLRIDLPAAARANGAFYFAIDVYLHPVPIEGPRDIQPLVQLKGPFGLHVCSIDAPAQQPPVSPRLYALSDSPLLTM